MKELKNTIYLIGFMGSGKSSVARSLKKKLNCKLVEMDETIVKEQGMSINEIFEKYGEDHFRDIETELVKRLGNEGGTVVSCGGGVVVRAENREAMKQTGKIVLLSATPETIYERVKHSTDRPLLNGNMNVGHIRELMEKRKSLYEETCDIKIDTDGKSVNEIADEIISVAI